MDDESKNIAISIFSFFASCAAGAIVGSFWGPTWGALAAASLYFLLDQAVSKPVMRQSREPG